MLIKFYELKYKVLEKDEQISKLISEDIGSKWIEPSNIIEIKYHIDSIMNLYKLIINSQKYTQKNIIHFNKISPEWINIIKEENNWIIEYSNEFTKIIQSWISNHIDELTQIEQQIQFQEISTESVSWQAVLNVQRISLNEYLKELNNMV